MKRYRKTERGGGLFSATEHEQAVASNTTGILKLRDLIPWESFRPLLEDLTGYATRDWSKGGKPPFDTVLMFKVLVLQKFHGLSGDAIEEQIFDCTSLKALLGLRIGDDIPDASFIEAPRQPNDREQNQRIKRGKRPADFDTDPAVGRQKDSQARWTKKNNEVHYGWKNHVKADLKTKLILKASTTPAHMHDSQVFKELLDDQDQAVLGDSAYHSEEHEAHLIELNAQEFLMRKARRGQPLSQQEQQTNHTISRMRVEHIFARMAQMGAGLCRSIGLKRATQHNHLSNLVYNLDRYGCIAR